MGNVCAGALRCVPPTRGSPPFTPDEVTHCRRNPCSERDKRCGDSRPRLPCGIHDVDSVSSASPAEADVIRLDIGLGEMGRLRLTPPYPAGGSIRRRFSIWQNGAVSEGEYGVSNLRSAPRPLAACRDDPPLRRKDGEASWSPSRVRERAATSWSAYAQQQWIDAKPQVWKGC